MRFLFRLELNLHAGAGKKFETLNLGTKHAVSKITAAISSAKSCLALLLPGRDWLRR